MVYDKARVALKRVTCDDVGVCEWWGKIQSFYWNYGIKKRKSRDIDIFLISIEKEIYKEFYVIKIEFCLFKNFKVNRSFIFQVLTL